MNKVKKQNTDKNTQSKLDAIKVACSQLDTENKIRSDCKIKVKIGEENYRSIFHNSQDAIMTLAPPHWRFTTCNPATLNMFKVPNEQYFLKYAPWQKLSPKYQPSGELSSVKAAREIATAMTRGSHRFEWIHKRLNGEIFPATVLLTKVVLPERTFLMATVRDMTKERKNEDDLQKSEILLKSSLEAQSDTILLSIDKNFRYLYFNRAHAENIKLVYGTKAEIGKSILECITNPADRIAAKRNYSMALRGKSYSEIREYSGVTSGYFESHFNPIYDTNNGKIIGATALARDVSDRKNWEDNLRDSEYLFKESQSVANIGSYKLDIKKNNWISSDTLNKIFGIDKDYQRTIDSWLKLVYKDDKPMMESYFANHVLKEHLPFNKEYRVVRQNDKSIIWVHGFGKLFYDKGGVPIHMIGTIQDITKAKESQEYIDWMASFPIMNPNPIVEIDKNRGVIFANHAAKKAFPALHKLQLKHPLLINLKDILEQTALTPVPSREILINDRWYIKTFSKPRPDRLRIYAVEVTRLHEAQNEIVQIKDRDESILESIGDAVFVVDIKGKIIIFNRVAAELTKISKNKAIGQHYGKVVNFVKESDGSKCNQFVTDAIADGKIRVMTNHVMLERRDGTRIPVADSAAPVKEPNGKLIGCVVIFHDMTKEYKIDKAKTEFVSLASHQLRTPLSTINWYSEILMSEDLGKLTPKQKQYSQEVYRASQRMVQLVNALLNVSRLELGTFSVEPKFVNVIDILTNSIKELKLQIHAKKLVIIEKYDSNVAMIKVDPKLMGIIFENLISNAVKYSRTGGKIEVKIVAKNGSMLVSIADNGIGIPKSQQKEIFTKLFRADNAKTMDPDGTGLGLYIVKEIIDYTGGKVWFTSSEGKGATFYASLPMSGMVKKTSNKQLI